MKYYAGDGKDTNIDIPTAKGDPDPLFTSLLKPNCYAYALNLTGVEKLLVGQLSGNATAGGLHSTTDFQHACEQDGLTYCGSTAPTPPFKAGEYYTVALFGSVMDMHWARIDSQGIWSDKMPDVKPMYSTFQNKGLAPHQIAATGLNSWCLSLRFISYYKVKINPVKQVAMNQSKNSSKKGCEIM